MRIAWICYSASNDLQKLFPRIIVPEQAPWISSLREGFAGQEEIDLHIVSPNYYKNQNTSFVYKGITFHLYKRHILLSRKVYSGLRVNYWTGFYLTRRRIAGIMGKIKPDLVHLFGTENAEYSAGILPLLNTYSHLVTIQGFRGKVLGDNLQNRYGKKLEENILRSATHFGVRTSAMQDYVFGYNPKAQFHWHELPFPKPPISDENLGKQTAKDWDLVFFGRVTPDKGIEDLLHAMARVKNDFQSVSLLVCGYVDPGYQQFLKELILRVNLERNVHFTGWLSTRQELFSWVQRAKISVLPTHYDNLPGTVKESMYLGIPVIVNNVDGMDVLNADRESVLLVEKGNLSMLAGNILTLLKDTKLATQLAENAMITAAPFFNGVKAAAELKGIYSSILSNCSKNTRSLSQCRR
jgi:glycosyltransferase involved in cell wall biosynthesis